MIRNTRSRPFPSSIEALEHRIAPAGVVTVAYDAASATLTVTGDDVFNEIDIRSTGADTNRVVVAGTTTLLGGGQFRDVGKIAQLNIIGAGGADVFRLFHLPVAMGINFDGGAGADSLEANDLTLKGNLTFNGGADSDSLTFSGSSVAVAGNVVITDPDAVTFANGAQKTVIGGSLLATGGTGLLAITAELTGSISIAKGIHIDAGSGGSTLVLEVIGSLNIGKLPTGESLLVDGGAGNDAVFILDPVATFAGGIRVLGDTGENTLSFRSNYAVKINKLASGHSVLFTNDGAEPADLEFNVGSLNLAGGVELTATADGNDFSITTRNGNAKIGKLPGGQSLLYQGGTGEDELRLRVGALTLAGAIEFAGGAGDNTLEISSPAGLVKIGKLRNGTSILQSGGTFDDLLTINAANVSLVGGIDFEAGSGNNALEFTGTASRVKLGAIATGKESVLYGGGLGTDRFITNVGSFIAQGGVAFGPGAGDNTLEFQGEDGMVSLGKTKESPSIIFAGNSGADTLRIDQTRVTLAGGITFNPANGENELEIENGSLVKIGALPTGESLQFVGGSGVDRLTLGGASLALKGSVVFSGSGAGDFVSTKGNVFAGKDPNGISFLLDGGPGANSINLQGSLTASGSMRVVGGVDTDILQANELGTLIIKGGLEFNGDAGNDQLRLEPNTLQIGRAIIFLGAGGDDEFSLRSNGFVRGDVVVDSGTNGSSVQFASISSRDSTPRGLTIRGSVEATMTGAMFDIFSVTNVVLGGDLTATFGAGNDLFLMDNAFISGGLNVDTGDGEDTLSIERSSLDFGPSSVAKLANIQTGGGNDTVQIGAAATSAIPPFPDPTRVRFAGGLTLDAGSGTDTRNDILSENDFPGGDPTGLDTFETIAG